MFELDDSDLGLDYDDPDIQQIIARYEDVSAQHKIAVDQIDNDGLQQHAAIEQEKRESDEQVREFYEKLEAERAAKRAQQQEAADASAVTNPWETTGDKPRHFAFGAAEAAETPEAAHGFSGAQRPHPGTGPVAPDQGGTAPVPPPPAWTAQAPPPPQPSGPTYSFGVGEEEEPAPSAPPPRPSPAARRAPRRSADEDDDEDFSNQSWLR